MTQENKKNKLLADTLALIAIFAAISILFLMAILAISYKKESSCYQQIVGRDIYRKKINGKTENIYKFEIGTNDETVITDSATYHDLVLKSEYYCPKDSTFK